MNDCKCLKGKPLHVPQAYGKPWKKKYSKINLRKYRIICLKCGWRSEVKTMRYFPIEDRQYNLAKGFLKWCKIKIWKE